LFPKATNVLNWSTTKLTLMSDIRTLSVCKICCLISPCF
jgi:hypothetical protein